VREQGVRQQQQQQQAAGERQHDERTLWVLPSWSGVAAAAAAAAKAHEHNSNRIFHNRPANTSCVTSWQNPPLLPA
jgi:hypothetical protein